MDAAEIIVTAGGVGLIAFIVWFFFGPRRAAQARQSAIGVREVDITVRGAYSPNRVEVEAGRPVRMTFVREEQNACTAQVIFPDFGVVKDLPVGRPVSVEFTPERAGEYPFHCGMNMVRGTVVVSPATEAPG
ncbi:MAG: cupredoxin domain-containing protein [Gemmataceae bacterium]|nr:cupredoxin domain-containing protein [Gemmataceae bacterium]